MTSCFRFNGLSATSRLYDAVLAAVKAKDGYEPDISLLVNFKSRQAKMKQFFLAFDWRA